MHARAGQDRQLKFPSRIFQRQMRSVARRSFNNWRGILTDTPQADPVRSEICNRFVPCQNNSFRGRTEIAILFLQ